MDWKLGGLIVGLALAGGSVRAEGHYLTGQKLRAQFDTGNRVAEAYIMGTLDTLDNFSWMFPAGGRLCLPLEVNSTQAAAVVKKYLDETPKDWHLPAPALIFSAMHRTWPCPKPAE